MQYVPCRTSVDSRFGRCAALILYPTVALFLLAALTLATISTFQRSKVHAVDYLWLLITGILAVSILALLLRISVCCYRMESKEIAISKDGFAIKGQPDKQYIWPQIHGVGIIAFAANASGQRYQKQICIFLHPIDDSSLKKLYRSYLYGAFHEKYFILMDYNASTVAILADECMQIVADYRSKQAKL